jgi:hypothetical protein
MGFKKHQWIPYNYHESGEIIAELRIRENFGKDLDFFRFGKNDLDKIIKILKQNYGFK